jgi:hypothetical protein
MLIPTAILGSYLGGRLTHALPRKVLRMIFIAFMVAMAYLTFTKAWQAAGAAPEPKETARAKTGTADQLACSGGGASGPMPGSSSQAVTVGESRLVSP